MKLSCGTLGLLAGMLLSLAFVRLLPAALVGEPDVRRPFAIFLLGIVVAFAAHKSVLQLQAAARQGAALGSVLWCSGALAGVHAMHPSGCVPVLVASACVYVALSTVVPRMHLAIGGRAIAAQCAGLLGGVWLVAWP